MIASTLGLHHVTAIATDPRRHLEFYTHTLGLRLVKQTVNFDDPSTYHLYYGDEGGRPGTLLTFFPWPAARRGVRGRGQATTVALLVPPESLSLWRQRLSAAGVRSEEIHRRFGEEVLPFYDPDGLRLELVAGDEAADIAAWPGSAVSAEGAVRGLAGVTLTVADAEPTRRLLAEGLGLTVTAQEGNLWRLTGPGPPPGRRVDLRVAPAEASGLVAAGTIHHVAFRTEDDASQARARETLGSLGLTVTPVQDRRYFRSIYFREPGGVLFEIATDPPGFTLDEPRAELGRTLQLPPWLEPHRQRIEDVLPPLTPAVGVRR